MSANFEVGQVVQLKPGGPEMTVVSVAEGKIQAAYNCTWFVTNSILVSSSAKLSAPCTTIE